RPEDYCAVQFFTQHAQRIRSDFSLETERDGVVRICTLVEGMPLALELAAAWVRSLSCAEIANEIARSLDFLKTRARNVPPRHQSMRAVLDQSWALLSPQEQIVLRRLSVLRGGFTREAAAVVAEASLPVLTALVDKSLLRWGAAGRYSLHELVRQYAERELKEMPDDFGNTRQRHTEYYMAFLESQWPDLLGSRPKEALHAIEDEIDNIRPAWTWAAMLGMEADINRGLDSLWFFYDTRGWYREGERLLELAAESLSTESPETDGSLLYGRVLARLGVLCNSIDRCDRARSQLETALAIFRRLDARAEMAFALTRLGEVVINEESFDQAQQLYAASLALYEEIGDRWGQAFALNWMSNLSDTTEERMRHREHSLAIFQALNSQWGIAIVTPDFGFNAAMNGEYQRALRLGHEALARCQEIGIRWGTAMSKQLIGFAAYGLRDYHAALDYNAQALADALELHLSRFLMYAAYQMARTLEALSCLEQAAAFDAVAYHYYIALPGEKYFVSFEDNADLRERARSIDPETEVERLLADLCQAEPMDFPEETVDGAVQALISELTEREIEILGLVSVGRSNRDVAQELYLSTGTVKWYLSQIYSKLGVGSRTQAIARARELQVIR
ncbi:MAG: hypothetical protein EHM39_05975, partial [Chloroflexi bacterium]